MTLLLMEARSVEEEFERVWRAWQAGRPRPLAADALRAEPLHNHFPFLLYGHFPQVSLRRVRAVALAARALGVYGLVQTDGRRGLEGAETVAEAGEWLEGFSREQWRSVLPEGSALHRRAVESGVEFRAALDREAAAFARPHEPCPEAEFLALAGDKAVLAGMTAAVLAELAGRPELLPAVRESQRYLYAGLRLSQDVIGWKADLVAGNWSYPVVGLFSEVLSCAPPESETERQAQLPEFSRHFYYSGFAERMLAMASNYFCRALAAVTPLPPREWSAVLAGMLERNEQRRREIAAFCAERLARRRSTVDGGGTLAGPGARVSVLEPSVATDALPEAPLRGAMDRAVGYLVGEQEPGGAWGDFMVLAEESTFWVTGYVGWTLRQLPRPPAGLSRAAGWLLAEQLPQGGWGYNSHWPQDADSIANVLLFLSGRPAEEWRAAAPALANLLAHQGPDGGFATIMDPEAWLSRFRSATDDLRGWTASHPCVTAVVALVLATAEDGRYRDRALQAVDHLRHRQQAAGHWEAYWWSGRLYTTARALQALSAVGEPDDSPVVARAREWVLASQAPDGSWSASEGGHGEAFHTALAIQALCVAGRGGSPAALRAAAWLLAHQLPDGSWPVAPILRVPRPQTLHPWEQATWRASILGLDIVVPDWRRVFTTATAVQACRALLLAQEGAVATRTEAATVRATS